MHKLSVQANSMFGIWHTIWIYLIIKQYHMKHLLFITFISLFSFSCQGDDFNVNNPDAKKFAEQLKDGSYDEFEVNDKGERLWTKMPEFDVKDIPVLIDLSQDTSLINTVNHFPLNPMSSLLPFRSVNGKHYIMLGEFILWCAEGAIKGKTYPSLTPLLRKAGSYRMLSGKEILEIRTIYLKWWNEFGKEGKLENSPLEGTGYIW